ncbi:MAG TPA: hypothetical protein VLG69_02330 [Candidatus Andersenbacteria bacterium]|nr:hypothetical protein [Candidatus Andersenbacteria bacterium]
MSSAISSSASLHAKPQLCFNEDIKIVTFSGISAAGKNFAASALQHADDSISMIRSFTTRKRRPGEQDQEYEHVHRRQFQQMRMQFLWRITAFQNFYGTKTSDIDEALYAERPRVMHLVHSQVDVLQKYASQGSCQRVFSFLVVCDDEETIVQRLRARDPGISDNDLGLRMRDILSRQSEYRSSGRYHALIRSTDQKSRSDVFAEMMQHLSSPIPAPRKF